MAEGDDDPVARARKKLAAQGTAATGQTSAGQAGGFSDYLGSYIQGTVLDPIEKAGEMAEHLPGGMGRAARSAGKALGDMPFYIPGTGPRQTLRDYVQQHKKLGEDYPITRFGGNVSGALMLPGKSKGVVGDAILGGIGGVLQPLDENDPNYWRDVGIQLGGGGLMGSIFGAAARGGEAAGRAAKNVYQHIYDTLEGVVGSKAAPKTITPATASAVRNEVGERLAQIYDQMAFNPNTAGWLPRMIQIRDQVRNSIVDPAIRERWESVFTNEVFRPIFQPMATSTRAPWISGQPLHQLMSHLSGEVNSFFNEARKGGANAMMWNQMARGLQQLHQGVGAIIDTANPAMGALRRQANEAYQWADVMWRQSKAGNRWIPPPKQIDVAAERKFGSTNYTAPGSRHEPVRQMLDKEGKRAAKANERGGALHEAVRIPGMIVGYEGGKMFGHPLEGAIIGSSLARASVPAVRKGAELAGRKPGAVGAAMGELTRGEEFLTTPRGAKWRPDEERK